MSIDGRHYDQPRALAWTVRVRSIVFEKHLEYVAEYLVDHRGSRRLRSLRSTVSTH